MNNWSSRGLSFAGSRAWTFLACAIVVAFAYSLCIRAINLSDEGYLLSQVLDMLKGKVLYRDMDAFVTPGVWFFLAGLFKIVEPSVLTSRILSFAGFLGTIVVSYRIVTGLTSPAYGWLTVGLLMISIWAFPAWTMLFYSPFAILFALAALERLLASRRNRNARNLVYCGVCLGFSVLCKQNYGAFASAGTFVALIAFRFENREPIQELLRGLLADCVRLSVGGLIVLLPAVGYLAYHGALAAAFDSLVIHPFVFMSHQDIPFPPPSRLFAALPLGGVDALTYGAYSYSQAPNPFIKLDVADSWIQYFQIVARLHILLFWLPPIGFLVGGFLSLRPSSTRRPIDGDLFAVLAVAVVVFLGVFPRADFNHLINVYQPAIVAIVLVMHRISSDFQAPRTILAKISICLGSALLFLYVVTAGTWYFHTLSALNSPVSSPFGGVLVSFVEQNLIDFQVEKIREMSNDGEFVLTVPALAMLNFLSDRPMPGRYYNLYEHHIAHDGGRGVVEAAEANSVSLVVADYNNFFSDRVGLRVYAPELAGYLRTHFEPKFDVAGERFQFLVRRTIPKEDRTSIDLVRTCDLEESDTVSVYAREHLLFASLYQARARRHPRAAVDTRCTFTVPERAELVTSIGYRKPAAAQRTATVTAEIWLANAGVLEPVFTHVIQVEPQDGWAATPAPEVRVDLAEFSGREITLLLRASFKGGARMSPMDLGGFSLIWHDLRIESRDGPAQVIRRDVERSESEDASSTPSVRTESR